MLGEYKVEPVALDLVWGHCVREVSALYLCGVDSRAQVTCLAHGVQQRGVIICLLQGVGKRVGVLF